MATVGLKLSLKGAEALMSELQRLQHRIRYPRPVLQKAANYMVRSVKNRLYTGTQVDGQKMAEMSPVTMAIRERFGDPNPGRLMISSGELLHSIHVKSLGNKTFRLSADAPQAGYMQFGVKSTNGWIKNKAIPARPFMGFSSANRRVIAKMMRDYLAKGEE